MAGAASAGAASQEAVAEMEPVIELEDVTKVYRTGAIAVAALRGVSFRIDPGEYVSIMGPSGSGKSTLMHILGCLDVPTSGQYWLNGEDVSRMDEIDLAEIRNAPNRLRLPAVQPAAVAVGLAQRGTAAHLRRRRARRTAPPGHRRLGPGRNRPTGSITVPASCPEVSSSAWPWPGPWSAIRR